MYDHSGYINTSLMSCNILVGDNDQCLILLLGFFSVYYYNFGWKDYGVASLTTILDMVKVMSFAVQEGKMAVHCHAGLGRTGL